MMEMEIVFSGGKKIDAVIGNERIQTDQSPSAGGDGSAPAPFALFLASIGTCAGIYVLNFCQSRNISTEGIKIIQKMNHNPITKLINQIDLEIQLPPEFPEHYKSAVIKSAQLCAVKKHLENPPDFRVITKTVDAENVYEDTTVKAAY